MALLRIFTNEDNPHRPYQVVCFLCPGCKQEHPYRIPKPGKTEADVRIIFPNGCWSWNGDLEKPTFQPSLLCNPHSPEHRCHLFVTDGKVRFCGDCHHQLAGQTVDMIPLED